MITGGILTAGITLPLIGVSKQALTSAMDYQSALNLMQAVSGATDEQMQKVAETAKALGADMNLPATSAGDAALAMTELAKAGLSVNDTLAAAKGVLQLAAAGALDEASAAEIVANALNAFNLGGLRGYQGSGFAFAAANASSAEVTDMADSLTMSAAVFSSANIPIEELVASIGQMANAGIKSSDAGTSLKQMILSLQAPSNKAADLMSDLGISIYDTSGNMLPFGDIISQFSGKLSGLTQEEKNSALATIFGSDAVRAANIILMGGGDAHNKMKDAVTQTGAATELANAKMEGFKGALEGLKSQVETVCLAIAEPFLDTLEGWARRLADLIPKIMDIDPALRNAALAFGAVLALQGRLYPCRSIISALFFVILY
jgi:TP901 family phage tail tape measure protein